MAAPGGVAPPALAGAANGAVGVAPAGSAAAAQNATAGQTQPRTIEDHVEAADHAAKFAPSMPVQHATSGLLMAKMDFNKPILASLLGDCPPALRKFLPYDSSYERNAEMTKRWFLPNSGTFTVSLLPAASEIESADLGPLHKVIMAFVRARLGMVDNKTNLFPEKISSASVFVTCMLLTCLVKIFNGAQGVELINLLTQYQSFVSGMQTLLLDRYESDGAVARTMKQVRGVSNDPAGQSAFACLNQCSLTAEKKKKELRTRCFKEALPRVDGIHSTLSQIRKTLLLMFVRVHHNQQLPLDFDYLLNGDSENAVEKPNPIFSKNKDLPIGLSAESLELLQLMKDDGHFHELYNVATQRMVALLEQPNANAVVESARGTQSVIQQSKRITYSQLLGERGLLNKLALAQASMHANDKTALMYPMLMAEVEACPALFLVSVLMRKMTSDLFMTQIQLANLTPIVASEAIEAYTLSLAEFATELRSFATRLIAARDHIASMSRFGFSLNYAGTTLLSSMVTGEAPVSYSSSSSSSSAAPGGVGDDTNGGPGYSLASQQGPSTASLPISPYGIQEFLKYWTILTKFKTDYNSLRYLNELGKLCEELKQQVDLLFEHIKVLRNSTDVVKSYAMMEQAITDLRKFTNGVIMATGTQVAVHDGELEKFRGMLQQQAALVSHHQHAMRTTNNISSAMQRNNSASPSHAAASSSSAAAAAASPSSVHANEHSQRINGDYFNSMGSPQNAGGFDPHHAAQVLAQREREALSTLDPHGEYRRTSVFGNGGGGGGAPGAGMGGGYPQDGPHHHHPSYSSASSSSGSSGLGLNSTRHHDTAGPTLGAQWPAPVLSSEHSTNGTYQPPSYASSVAHYGQPGQQQQQHGRLSREGEPGSTDCRRDSKTGGKTL